MQLRIIHKIATAIGLHVVQVVLASAQDVFYFGIASHRAQSS